MTAKKVLLPKSRHLTISYQVYESRCRNGRSRQPRQVPFLRLSGDWLSAAGFKVGQKARVQVTNQGILILPEG
jgi:toxic protein SymE